MAQDKYYFSTKKSTLKSVNQSIVSDILSMYEQGDNLSLIKEKYPTLNIRNTLYIDLPYELTAEKCACGELLYKKIKGRTTFSMELYYCPNCKHDGTDFCSCLTCSQKRKDAKESRKNEFLENWEDYYEKHYSSSFDIQKLSIFEEVQVVALIHLYYDKDASCFNFESSNNTQIIFGQRILPEEIYQYIQAFISKKVLIPKKHIEFDDERNYYDEFGQFTPNLKVNNCKWILNLSLTKSMLAVNEVYNYLVKKSYSPIQLEILWKEYYQEKILRYFEYSTKSYFNIDLIPQNIILISDELFEHISLSKAYCLIYYAIHSLIKYQAKYKTNTKRSNTYLRNQILVNIEKYSKAENYSNLKDFAPIDFSESFFIQYLRRYIFPSCNEYFYYSLSELKNKF